MKINRFAALLMLICFFILTSCTKMVYKYQNQSYDTPELALSVQEKDIDSMVSRIPETTTPVGGNAVIILPDNTYIEKYFVRLRGSALSGELKDKSTKYVVESMKCWMAGKYRTLEKRKIFDKVVVEESNDPQNAIFNNDIAIILLKKDTRGIWFLKRKWDSPMILKEMEEISTALPPLQREILWLDKIENTSRGK